MRRAAIVISIVALVVAKPARGLTTGADIRNHSIISSPARDFTAHWVVHT
jgi:hypothetical protein